MIFFFYKAHGEGRGQNPTGCFPMQFARYEEPVISGEGQNEQANK